MRVEYTCTQVCQLEEDQNISPTPAFCTAFLLNHSTEYGLAAVFGWTEYMLECWLFPGVKVGFISAIGMCILTVIRSTYYVVYST